jgi:DSF synthase
MSNVAYINEVTSDQQAYANQSQLKTYYDARNRIIWLLMKGAPRPAFTVRLLNEITDQIKTVKQDMAESNGEKYDFLVLGSDTEGVFNLGGDLDLFCQYIRNRDRDALLRYAKLSIDLVYQNMIHFGENMTSISLIQGDALGGGFEAAFSANVVVAERGAKCGLPEVLFNLFPGMGGAAASTARKNSTTWAWSTYWRKKARVRSRFTAISSLPSARETLIARCSRSRTFATR